MKKLLIFSFLLLITNINAQDKKPGNGSSVPFGSYILKYDDERVSLFKGDKAVSEINIRGRKVIVTSVEGSKLVLINYAFSSRKENYPITYYLLDKEAGAVYSSEITGYYDMPHPLFTVNSDGIVGYCDPGTLILTIDNNGTKTEFKLFEGAGYEMERGIFIRSDRAKIYIAGNLRPVALELQEDNVFLVASSIESKRVDKVFLPYLAVKSFNISDDNLILDAYHFKSGYTEKRIIVDKTLKLKD